MTRVNHFFILVEREATGRLLRYDPPTKPIHVVLHGLAFPNGIQLFEDQSFLLLTETTNYRLMKLWLEGPKTGTVELVADLPGFTDNARINDKGQFWVAIDCCRTPAQDVLTHNPWMRIIYFQDSQGVAMKIVSEVREVKGKLWIGTMAHHHIATLPYPYELCIN